MQGYTIVQADPDPKVVLDADACARIADSGRPWKLRHDRTGIVLHLCPAGEFMMGSPETETGRNTDEFRHRRRISSAFYLSVTAVTQEQWLSIMGSNPSKFKKPAHPVEGLSWMNCKDFIGRAGDALRLPTEAEWEYGCRAGTVDAYAFGASVAGQQICFNGIGTIACGSLPANRWGFHEMHGNVWEWVEDAYSAYPSAGGTQVAISGPAAAPRVLRGGDYTEPVLNCRSANRLHLPPDHGLGDYGFRVARTAE